MAVFLAVAAGPIGATPAGAGDPSVDEGRPRPSPVAVRAEPEGVTLADPSFEALPGARADFGRLGGSVYRIEMPDDWNGKLVLWMHGWEEFGPEASVSAPDLRGHLVARGYAWGASSFSTTSWIPGRSTDETAALWDHFVDTYGRPERTYVIGLSMGGAAGHVAAERQGERFDGVLALCGAAGATPGLRDGANFLVAAAYAAGVTQDEYDNADLATLVEARIQPALRDRRARDRFERAVVALTGGPRPFDREGIRLEEETSWRRLLLSVGAGVVPPRVAPYDLEPSSGIDEADFNRRAIRLRSNEAALAAFTEGNELTGNLQVPLLTLHSTGDGQVPIEHARALARLVDDAGRSELLVQRVIRDPGHCGFNTAEWVANFEALVRWVERGDAPSGNRVRRPDLGLRRTFELLPRSGVGAAAVLGSDDRALVRGRATLDGAAFDARFVGIDVIRDGLVTACGLGEQGIEDGRFRVEVRAEAETDGCGTRGAELVAWTVVDDVRLTSTATRKWPGAGRAARLEFEFSRSAPQGAETETTAFVGEVWHPDGRLARPGSRVEGRVDGVVCGVTSLSRSGGFSGFTIKVVGPDAVPGCDIGATITFHVGGRRALQTAPNEPGGGQGLDLTLR
jgi:pimeloyl-ACP methyl ester carboxylesterase